MRFFEIFTIAVVLGADAFSVAMVIGVQQYELKSIIRISSIVALFHILMPLFGIYGGKFIRGLFTNFLGLDGSVEGIFNLIGGGLLLLIGFYMIVEKIYKGNDELSQFSINGWGGVALASSVSMDAFSIGVGLGISGNIVLSSVLIFGIVAGLMMGTGLYLGSKAGPYIGERAQIVGGFILIILGLHFAEFI